MRIAVIYDGDAPSTPSEDVTATARDIAKVLGGFVHPIRRPVTLPRADLVFNVCEGLGGDARHEAHVAAALELAGIPFTGNDAFALSVALDKGLSREIFAAQNIPIARGFNPSSSLQSPPHGLKFPLIVKPRREDGSIHIDSRSLCRNRRDLRARIRTLGAPNCVVEEYVDGREFSVALLGDEVLAASEMRYATDTPIVTYHDKWYDDQPENDPIVHRPVPAKLARLARAAAKAVGCTSYCRVDIRGGVVLEVNPNPDISRGAGFARAARARGWSYEELVRRIAEWRGGRSCSRRGFIPRAGSGKSSRKSTRSGSVRSRRSTRSASTSTT